MTATSRRPNNRREHELGRLVLGRRNWLFTWLDVGGERTAAVLSITATCIAHDVNPRAYLHLVTRLIVNGWPQAKLRELLPDRILVAHPTLGSATRWSPPATAYDPGLPLPLSSLIALQQDEALSVVPEPASTSLIDRFSLGSFFERLSQPIHGLGVHPARP
jgi:hypothetical protein